MSSLFLVFDLDAQPNQNISLVSEALVTGFYTDVKTVGDRIWCTNTYGVVVYTFDGAHPENPPIEIGRFPTPGQSQGLFIQDSLCYVADGSRGLRIYDVSNLGKVEEVGACENLGYVFSVVVGEGVAYIAVFRSGVYSINVEDPSNPERMDFYQVMTESENLFLSENLLWTVLGRDDAARISAINISNPSDLQLRAQLESKPAGDFSIVGDQCFLDSDSCYALDISNPDNISIISAIRGRYPREQSIVGAYYHNGYLYGDVGPLSIVDARDPRRMQFAGYLYPDGISARKQIAVTGNYLIIANYHRGLKVVAVADPTNPVVEHINLTSGQPVDVTKQGHYLYVADQLTGQYPSEVVRPGRLRVFDISNINYPRQINMVDSVTFMTGVDPFSRIIVRDSLAILTGSLTRIYRITNPRRLRNLYNPGDFQDENQVLVCHNVKLIGNLLISAGYPSIFALTIEDPTHLRLAFNYDPGWERIPLDVFVVGDYLVVPSSIGGGGRDYQVLTYDWSDPNNLRQVGNPCTIRYPCCTGIQEGDYLYLVSGNTLPGLSIVNIADPLNPQEVYFSEDVKSGYQLKVYRDHLFVADGKAGIRIFNLENLERPRQVAYYDTPDDAQGLDVDPDLGFIYVADQADISIYDCGAVLGIWDLTISETSHDYGAIRLDSTATWELIMTNEAEQTITIDSVNVDRNNFSIEIERGLAIEAGQQVYARAGFTPDSSRQYNCTLMIYSSGRVLSVFLSGAGEPLSIVSDAKIPNVFALHNAFPNPFNGATVLRFSLPKSERVRLSIYDISGREVIRLAHGQQSAGYHSLVWDGTAKGGKPVISGVYIICLEAEGLSRTSKMTLIK